MLKDCGIFRSRLFVMQRPAFAKVDGVQSVHIALEKCGVCPWDTELNTVSTMVFVVSPHKEYTNHTFSRIVIIHLGHLGHAQYT